MTGDRPLISAIIPTHNRSALLREALDSVMAVEGQGELFDLETVVVDDASSDGTQDVVARYPVRYIRNAVNRGLSASRNIGAAASHGQYMAFLDDDDLWIPERFKAQITVMESRPEVGLAYSPTFRVFNGIELPIAPVDGPSGYVFEQLLLRGNFLISVLAVLIRRTAFERVGGFEGAGIEDYDMFLRLARYFPFAFVASPVALRRWSSAGLFLTLIATGRSRPLYRELIARALALKPRLSGRFRERVIDRMELGNLRDLLSVARPLRDLPDSECVSQVLAHISEYPRLARLPHGRRTLAWFARTVVLASPSPFDTATTLCEGVERSCGASIQTRRLLARIWMELAVGFLLAGQRPLSARALALALRNDPTQFVARLASACVDRARFLRRDAQGPVLEEQYALLQRRGTGQDFIP
ncbi:MAG TPA: glycosyltransferase family 2 protein [bacterium]|nr:glycosyltransferase family 2 protein [bacterium]